MYMLFAIIGFGIVAGFCAIVLNKLRRFSRHQTWFLELVEKLGQRDDECYFQFEFRPRISSVVCFNRRDVQEEIATLKDITEKEWDIFWRFIEQQTLTTIRLKPQEGEKYRKFCIAASPKRALSYHTTHPHRLVLWLAVEKKRSVLSSDDSKKNDSGASCGYCCHGC